MEQMNNAYVNLEHMKNAIDSSKNSEHHIFLKHIKVLKTKTKTVPYNRITNLSELCRIYRHIFRSRANADHPGRIPQGVFGSHQE